MARFNMQSLRSNNTTAATKNQNKVQSAGAGLLNENSRALNEKNDFNIVWIKLSQIRLNEKNKYHIDDKEIQDMIVSIRTFGIRQNLEVRKIDDYNYVLVTGEKRYRALKYLYEHGEHSEYAPCILKDLDKINLPLTDEEKEILSISETNSTQRDYTEADMLHEISSLDAIYTKLRNAGVTDFEGRRIKGEKNRQIIANQLGISTGTVQKFQRVNKNASEKLKEEIQQGNISVNVAEKIVDLPMEEQDSFIEEVKSSGKTKIDKSDVSKLNENQSLKVDKMSEKEISVNEDVTDSKMYIITKNEILNDMKELLELAEKEELAIDLNKYDAYKKHMLQLKKLFF